MLYIFCPVLSTTFPITFPLHRPISVSLASIVSYRVSLLGSCTLCSKKWYTKLISITQSVINGLSLVDLNSRINKYHTGVVEFQRAVCHHQRLTGRHSCLKSVFAPTFYSLLAQYQLVYPGHIFFSSCALSLPLLCFGSSNFCKLIFHRVVQRRILGVAGSSFCRKVSRECAGEGISKIRQELTKLWI